MKLNWYNPKKFTSQNCIFYYIICEMSTPLTVKCDYSGKFIRYWDHVRALLSIKQ